MYYLDAKKIIHLHQILVDYFRATDDPIEPAGPRDLNLVESATGRPRTSLGSAEKYQGVDEKAAALFHSLVKNHAFHNGNKRTALFALLAFLDANNRHFKSEISDDDVFDMVIGVAKDSFPEEGLPVDKIVAGIANWLGARTSSKRARSSTMSAREFIARCESANLRVKEDSQGWQVYGKGGIVKIPHSTRQITGNVVRVNLQNLGLSEAESGITVDAFQDGVSSDSNLLRRFQAVLKRLAHA